MSPRRHVVAVPVDQALAYTAERGWHVLSAPPAGWLEEQDARVAADERPVRHLRLVPGSGDSGEVGRSGRESSVYLGL